MMPKSKWFLFGYGIVILFLIILLGSKISFIFHPIVVFFQTLFFPFLISGVLYYLFRPVVDILMKLRFPRSLAILTIYLVVIGLMVLFGFLIGPPLSDQVEKLIKNLPSMMDIAQVQFVKMSHHPWIEPYVDWNEISQTVVSYLKTSYAVIGDNIANFISVVTNIITVLVTVPFILYYMLREGHKTPDYFLQLFPEWERKQGMAILRDLDLALSSYIKGQVIVSMSIGVLLYIGYLIIGIDYSLLLAIIAMFTNVIPFIGPLLGMIPALIVALITSPDMVYQVVIVAVLAQQLEGNLISPYVMGKSLKIHPLTIILVLLVAGSLGGFLGLLLAVPTYAVSKVIVVHAYRLYALRRQDRTLGMHK
ncbi:putative PurR-regulated permease PerM [Baia soyae]|uniref:Putative PurR-regulated permease PerM n=2 Tax=Baia soyae TaxID=1544746 RepID=A0A4R2RG49_9BACL|nr:putative PurR-regulated permease PerM [Baia soyae]